MYSTEARGLQRNFFFQHTGLSGYKFVTLLQTKISNILDDILSHDEFGKVDNEPRKVADEEDHDNTDQNNRQVHLIVLTRFVLPL